MEFSGFLLWNIHRPDFYGIFRNSLFSPSPKCNYIVVRLALLVSCTEPIDNEIYILLQPFNLRVTRFLGVRGSDGGSDGGLSLSYCGVLKGCRRVEGR